MPILQMRRPSSLSWVHTQPEVGSRDQSLKAGCPYHICCWVRSILTVAKQIKEGLACKHSPPPKSLILYMLSNVFHLVKYLKRLHAHQIKSYPVCVTVNILGTENACSLDSGCTRLSVSTAGLQKGPQDTDKNTLGPAMAGKQTQFSHEDTNSFGLTERWWNWGEDQGFYPACEEKKRVWEETIQRRYRGYKWKKTWDTSKTSLICVVKTGANSCQIATNLDSSTATLTENNIQMTYTLFGA